jgi:prepilin-type N-terminal cleavage/methylation domain-containing protein
MRDKRISVHNRCQRAGFTLIELLVVIVIIGILAAMSIPMLNQARIKAKETQVAANLSDIQRALEAFGTDNNGLYPFRMWSYQTSSNTSFDPLNTNLPVTSSDAPSYFSLGLFGGVRVVNSDFSLNTDQSHVNDTVQRHIVIQPYGWSDAEYRIFNQYSDPLRALGYLADYPENPFLKRPMGNVFWAYGDAHDADASRNGLDRAVPNPDVYPTPGDFCYTFFYRIAADGQSTEDPPGVAERKRSYVAKSETNTLANRVYYLDMVDSYQLWAYGNLSLNGGWYQAYPNNSWGGARKAGNTDARKDWDNNGFKDMYEIGMVAYYKRSANATGYGSQISGRNDTAGNRNETPVF